jgi:hypothetical protein
MKIVPDAKVTLYDAKYKLILKEAIADKQGFNFEAVPVVQNTMVRGEKRYSRNQRI